MPEILPRTPRCERVLRNAEERARAVGAEWVGTEHLLIALFQDGQAVAENMHQVYRRRDGV
jgi:ATP-dependent Clp protease ATP-binding subunit ClpA